jgi:diguanylate cyclase (GGDEF)-like protein/putative nucleotidyltransferase with HDIG domain
MSLNARIYSGALLALGFFVIVAAFADDGLAGATKFAAYLSLACMSSILKVGMPGPLGSTSISFIFVLMGIVDLTLAQALLVGIASMLIEGLWHPKQRATGIQLLLGVANMSVAVYCTRLVYRSPLFAFQNYELPIRLLAATTVLFAANTFASSAIISLSEQASLIRTWRDRYFGVFPYYLAGAAVVWAFEALSEQAGWQTSLLLLPIVYLIYRTWALHLLRLEDNSLHAEEMANLHLRTIEALALAIEAKDNTTHDHLKRVQVYAIEVGKLLGITKDELEALRVASLLHDIGKLAVPEHIISKPGRLTPDEFEKMKVHVVVGAEILEHVRFPFPVVPIVSAHHEKWNGTGYPLGLRGTDIPVGARILSAVDALDALASDRQYRRALPLPEAMSKIEQESGRSFDPAVVEILKTHYVDLERKAQVGGSADAAKLSTNLKIERGGAPAAGYESMRTVESADDPKTEFPHLLAAARREIQAVFDVGESGGGQLDLNELIAVLAVRLKRLLPFNALALYYLKSDTLIPGYVTGDNFRLFSSLRIPMGQGLSGWVAENRKPIINGNPSVEPGYLNDPTAFSTMRSALAVPLEGSSGVIGVLSLYHEDKDAFTKDHLRLMQTIAPKLALSLELQTEERDIDESETVDNLTGFPHAKTLFLHLDAELTRCRRLNAALGVVVCTVDGWKEINERYGRLEGDKLLRAIGVALKDTCREFDYIARISADEFAIVMPGVNREALLARSEKLANSPLVPGRKNLRLIVGQAAFPEDGATGEQLMGEADRRMFQSQQTRDLAANAEMQKAPDWLQ